MKCSNRAEQQPDHRSSTCAGWHRRGNFIAAMPPSSELILWTLCRAERRLTCRLRLIPSGSECSVLYDGLPVAVRVLAEDRDVDSWAANPARVGVDRLDEHRVSQSNASRSAESESEKRATGRGPLPRSPRTPVNTAIAEQRLGNQCVSRPRARPGDVITWRCRAGTGYAAAKWALECGWSMARPREVERAFSEGRILRARVRPTWHFVHPGRPLDAWATAGRVHQAMAYASAIASWIWQSHPRHQGIRASFEPRSTPDGLSSGHISRAPARR